MGNYELILCDPPWQYGNKISNGAAENHYKTMTLSELKRLPIWDVAAKDAVLAMWYTGTHTEEAIELAQAWGFRVRTMKGFTWVKLNRYAERRFNMALESGELVDFSDLLAMLNNETRMNGGNYTRANTEDLLIATHGIGLERVNASIKQVVYTCLGEHSEKPWEVRHRLELLYGDVRRVELFARDSWPGWDRWGNQCNNSFEIIPGRILNNEVKG